MGVNILSMAASIRRVESRENSPGETNVTSDIQLWQNPQYFGRDQRKGIMMNSET